MQLSANTFKAIQGFLITGIPFIWWFWISGMIPFNFALLALFTLVSVILFFKLELITFIALHGIDSVHDHLSHMEKYGGSGDGDPKVRITTGEEALEALTSLRDKLQEAKTSIDKAKEVEDNASK